MSGTLEKGILIDPITEQTIKKRLGRLGVQTDETVAPGKEDIITKAPSREDPEVQAAREKERKLQRLRKGRQSTILSKPPQQGGKTLLGQ